MLLDPTTRPDENVMTGAGDYTPQKQSKQEFAMFAEYLPMLEIAANMETAAPTFIRFVQYLRSMQ